MRHRQESTGGDERRQRERRAQCRPALPGHERTACECGERESERERAQSVSVESEDEEKRELDVPHPERRRPA